MARVLIVDDAPVNRDLLTAILRPQGHSVIEAADGAAALEKVRHEPVDLVFCDVLMPVLDGYEFARKLRAEPGTQRIPVVFCTAYFLDDQARALAAACGVHEVISKPFEPAEILRMVRLLTRSEPVAPRQDSVREQEFEQRHLQIITQKLSEKITELQASNDNLTALVDLNLQLASERSRERLLSYICSGACRLLDADYGTVAVRHPDDDSLILTSHHGIDEARGAAMQAVRIDAGELGRVDRESRPMRLSLRPAEALETGLPMGYPDLAELLAAPIRSIALTYGWIGIGRRPGGAPFTDAQMELLSVLGAQAGRIFENGSLYGKLKRYAGELEAEIVERERAQLYLSAQYEVAHILSQAGELAQAAGPVLQVIGGRLGFAAATLWIVDERNENLRFVDAWCSESDNTTAFIAHSRQLCIPPGSGLPGMAWASGEPVWSQQLQHPDFLRRQVAFDLGLSCGGAIPVVVGERVIGVVDVFTREACELDARLSGTLSALGDQIGQFFERSRQQDNISRLSRVYAVLSEINSTIVRVHDRRRLLQETCRIAVDRGGYGTAWVGQSDPATGEIVPLAWAGTESGNGAESLLPPRTSASEAALRDCLRSGQVRSVEDLSIEADESDSHELQRGFRSLIALPLTVDDKVIGAIVLYSAKPGFFTADEKKLLTELAHDVSFALQYIARQDLLAHIAFHDVLTGLPNRTHLLSHLSGLLQHVKRNARDKLALVLWDLNRFRQVNETFGRSTGDRLLGEVGLRLRRLWPEGGEIARIDADRFACSVIGELDLVDIAHLVETTRVGLLALPVQIDEHELRFTVSSGIALAMPDDSGESLLSNAEIALREARKTGVASLFYGPEMNALVAETLMLENRLHKAVEEQQFVLHYQPKVSCSTGRITGLEALLRWQAPERGLVPPGRFIPLLEETGLIREVGLWAIRKAVADSREWRALGVDVPRIAVNVSPIQLRQPDFVATLQQAIMDEGSLSRAPDLEITESMLMTDFAGTVERLCAARRMGSEVSIDDFGTGYSSLGYLARLPVDALKIDKSFVANMSDAAECRTIVATIVALAHSLRLKVVAEGVEDEYQAEMLRALDCDELQGYLISRPLPAETLLGFLERAPG